MKWFNTLSHNRWLEQETDRIFSFGKHAAVPTGFGWLGNNGQVKPDNGTHLWITARMLHVYAVAASMGRPGAYQLVEHGINALNGALRDKNMAAGTPASTMKAFSMPQAGLPAFFCIAGRRQRRYHRSSGGTSIAG